MSTLTKKQIAKAYIDLAEGIISKNKRTNKNKFLDILCKNYLQNGVCYFVERKFDKYIFNQKYIKIHIDSCIGNCWYKCPRYCFTKKEMIECLQYRINILKTWL